MLLQDVEMEPLDRTEAQARGVKLDWKDFVPEPIPDEENYAATTLFRRLFSREKAVNQSPLGAPFSGWLRDRITLESSHGRPIDFGAGQRWLLEHQLINGATDDPVADVLGYLQKFEPVLTEQQFALERPGGQLPSHWEKGLDADFFNGSDQFAVQLTIGLKMAAMLREGRQEEAYTLWRVLARNVDLLNGEPSLLAAMSRVMLMRQMTEIIGEGLPSHSWSDDSLRSFEDWLSVVDLLFDLRFGLESERAFVNSLINQICGENNPREVFGRRDWMLSLMPEGCIDRNLLLINRAFDQRIGKIGDGAFGGMSRERQETPQRNWFSRVYWALADAILVGFRIEDQYEAALDGQQRVGLCRIACAVERYRLRHGSLPPTLDDLVPEFLPILPADLFAERPLRDVETDGIRKVYSVGGNGNDDGGNGVSDIIWILKGSEPQR